MAPICYFSGRFLAFGEAGLAWHDAGVVYGATATDLIRTFRHRLFRLDAHVRRFRESCDLCRIPLAAADAELGNIAEELALHNARLISTDSDLALVMFATPGPLGRFTGASVDGPPTLAMHTFPLPFERYRRMFVEGARLAIPPTRHVPSASVDRRAKQRSRMHWWIAAHEIDPATDALLLDDNGFVTETAAANMIAVIGNELIVPPNCLPGISLQLVRELAEAADIHSREQPLTPAQCLAAEELIVTSSTYCLAGVSQLDGHALQWPGPVYSKLLAAYSQHVGIGVKAQILTAR